MDVGLSNGEFGTFIECFFCGALKTLVRTLKRCSGCQLVTYCSRECQLDDWGAHKRVCKEFPVVNGRNVLHTTGPWEKHLFGLRRRAALLPNANNAALPIFRYPKVCHTCQESRPEFLTVCKCACVVYCSKTCTDADKLHRISCSYLSNVKEAYALETMRQSYPASFWQFLGKTMENVPNFKVGPDGCRPENLTILNMHIVTNTAYFDAVTWEFLFHRLTNLKQLNLVFVIQNNGYNPYFNRRCEVLTKLGCTECESNDRIIMYSVHQKPYHMFFSSSEYTEPDFIVAYGVPIANGDIHNEISYRNMTYCSHSILVLMDSTKDLLIQAAKDVKAAQPSSSVMYSADSNRSRGFGSNKSDLDFDADAPNVKHYISICFNRTDSKSAIQDKEEKNKKSLIKA